MKTVFFDVDTQLDFLYPAGALSVPGAESIVGALGELTRFAAATGRQIISTADAHTEDDPEFRTWKPHCVVGTTGQQKSTATLKNEPRAVIDTRPNTLQNSAAGQIIIEKQQLNCFTNPNLAPLLEKIAADRYILYGVVSELCVQCAAFGLLETGAAVELVVDAIKSLNSTNEQDMIARFRSRGGIVTTLSAVIR